MSIRSTFSTLRVEDAILPPDLLRRIADGDRALEGLTPTSYHLDQGEKLMWGFVSNGLRLRELAMKRRGTRHSDPYHSLRPVMEKLGDDASCPELALTARGH